jgi:hypothetical protein
MGRVIAYASRPHYADHVAPLADRLADVDVAVVASYRDLCLARRTQRRIVLMQHGAGQSYSDENPAYPGGRDNDAVGLFLTPNHHSADRWRARYPRAAVEVVGSPRLDDLPVRSPGEGPVVAFGWHWSCSHSPECSTAFPFYSQGVLAAARTYTVLGHGHPRRSDLARFYRKAGIEYVPSFEEVCRRADVYVADNTSSLFEFAATGRPVVVLDSPRYRRDVDHGLRFWDAADVGVRIQRPEQLVPAIARALELRDEDVDKREAAVDVVYAYRGDAADRAAEVIRAWA